MLLVLSESSFIPISQYRKHRGGGGKKKRVVESKTWVYNVYEISSSACGEFQSKTSIFHGFLTVQYSRRVY